jgi:hypothetical protein
MAGVVLGGCGLRRMALPPSFWQERTLRVGVALVEYPVAGAYSLDRNSFVGKPTSSAATVEMNNYLKKTNLQTFGDTRDLFVNNLRERGMEAKAINAPIRLDDYPKYNGPKTEGEPYKKDLRSLKEKEGIDRLIFLTVTRFGTLRNYSGLIPIGRTKALFMVKGEMVDLKDNRVLWRTAMSEFRKQGQGPIENPWDQPPDYPHLTKALEQVLEKGKRFLWSNFFPSLPLAK